MEAMVMFLTGPARIGYPASFIVDFIVCPVSYQASASHTPHETQPSGAKTFFSLSTEYGKRSCDESAPSNLRILEREESLVSKTQPIPKKQGPRRKRQQDQHYY